MSDVLVQYLREARATETGLAQTLQVHLAATPPGEHRARLEQHLEETRAHEGELARRIDELDEDGDPLRQALDLVSGPVGYGLGTARGPARARLSLVGMPLALLRGPDPSAAGRRRRADGAARAGDQGGRRTDAVVPAGGGCGAERSGGGEKATGHRS